MSLQLRILKINNELISIFATLDGWIDQFTHENVQKTQYKGLYVIVMNNARIISKYQLVLEPAEWRSAENLLYKESLEELTKDLEGNTSLKERNIAMLRDVLRGQLFTLLTILDSVHTDCLNPFASSEVNHHEVLGALEELINDLVVRIGIKNMLTGKETL